MLAQLEPTASELIPGSPRKALSAPVNPHTTISGIALVLYSD
jgi:hypothetical protein